jgi:hypothetical protein
LAAPAVSAAAASAALVAQVPVLAQ